MGEITDKVKGKLHQVEGDITGDKALHAQGVAEEMRGKVKGAVKDVEKAVKDVSKDVSRNLSKK